MVASPTMVMSHVDPVLEASTRAPLGRQHVSSARVKQLQEKVQTQKKNVTSKVNILLLLSLPFVNNLFV